MNYEISNEFLNDIEFIKNSKHISFNPAQLNNIDFNNLDDEFKDILLYSNHECLLDFEYYNKFIEIVNSSDRNIKLLQSSSSKIPYSLNPITSIFLWKNSEHFAEFKNGKVEKTIIFPKERFFLDKNISSDRYNKFILSWRRANSIRNDLFEMLPSNVDGICRYSGVTDEWFNHENDRRVSIKDGYDYVEWDTILDEYENSFVSFVSETGNLSNIKINPLTDKTLLSILTGTMPIIYNGVGALKELEDIGIKTFNKEFGYKEGDLYYNRYHKKNKLYIDCFNNVNNMSISDIKNIYQSNIHHIKRNYDIVCNILNYEF